MLRAFLYVLWIAFDAGVTAYLLNSPWGAAPGAAVAFILILWAEEGRAA